MPSSSFYTGNLIPAQQIGYFGNLKEAQEAALKTAADLEATKATLLAAQAALQGAQSARDQAQEAAETVAGGSSYTYTQGIAATVWSFNHPLLRIPSVELFDDAGNEIESDVTATDIQVIVTFASPTSGTAVLS